MTRYKLLAGFSIVVVATQMARADVVTDWNITLNDAIIATPSKHNPGNPTRAMAMMNSAIYDVFQAINRTHVPFKYDTSAPGANLDAAVAEAAYVVLSNTYGEQQSTLDSVRTTRLGAIADSPDKTAGITLGNTIGQFYVNLHANDGSNQGDSYVETGGPGRWTSDPLHPGQKGWGKAWGTVTPWTIQGPDQFDAQFPVMGIPAFNTQAYVDAFNQVKDYGALNSGVRSPVQTQIGLFWAYDRPNLPGASGVGPPPVLFIENLKDIATQVGNTPGENARLFAMASVSMADAAIAAWDVKFETDFWRPITAIRADTANDDDNLLTVEDPSWVYLGAPGSQPGSLTDDFTPPFPAYTSGHATMGGAVFKTLELFYGTNVFDQIDGILGNDLLYDLHSNEAGGGGTRSFDKFTQTVPLTVGSENSPEGENAISRIYLGIHWIFDAVDGTNLGHKVAEYAAGNHFQPVPEPSSLFLVMLGIISLGRMPRRRCA